jgi:hypothetical protein
VAKPGEPTRTPDSGSDAGRHFRDGCLFLIGTVIVLWIAIWAFWTFWPK